MTKRSGLGVCLDSSLGGCAVAFFDVADRSGPLLWRGIYGQRDGSSEMLPRFFEQGLRALGARVRDLQVLVLGVGPGSFTGIKVGLSFGHALMVSRPGLSGVGLCALSAGARSRQTPACFFLPSTRLYGYAVGLPSSGQEAEGARFVEVSQNPWGDRAVVLVGSWPEVMTSLLKAQRSVEEVSLESFLSDSLQGMLGSWDEAAISNALPQPRYLRPSAPESRFKPL